MKKSLFLILLMLPFLISCSTVMKTYSYKDKKADLNQYKTYAWINLEHFELDNKAGNKLYAHYILDLANKELEKKGFILDVNNPDAVFLFDTQIDNKIAYSQTPQVSVGVGVAGPGYYVGGAVPVAGGNIIEEQYQEGLLFIEMFDSKTNNLVWKGWAQEEVNIYTNGEDLLQRAVTQIFMRLPVKHK
jgi:hypothetical protein